MCVKATLWFGGKDVPLGQRLQQPCDGPKARNLWPCCILVKPLAFLWPLPIEQGISLHSCRPIEQGISKGKAPAVGHQKARLLKVGHVTIRKRAGSY